MGFAPRKDSAVSADPRDWAKHPVSETAIRVVISMAGDPEFDEIIAGLKERGVVSPDGQMLKRWDSAGKQWVKA